MTEALVGRLKAASKGFISGTPDGYYGICREAADEIERLTAAIDTIQTEGASDGWQAIETLPSKGEVIGYDGRWGVCEIMRSDQMDYWAVATFNGQLIRASDLRAWRPLPLPPGESIEGASGLREALEDLPRLIELQRTAAPEHDRDDGWNAGLDRAAAMVREAFDRARG